MKIPQPNIQVGGLLLCAAFILAALKIEGFLPLLPWWFILIPLYPVLFAIGCSALAGLIILIANFFS